MNQEGKADPIFTRRSLAAAVVAGVVSWALFSSITGLQFARDGAGPGCIAWGVSFLAGVMVITMLLAYVLAIWARRVRYTPREPVAMVAAVTLFSAWISLVYAIGMMLNGEGPRRIFLTAGTVAAIMWAGGALAGIIALRIRHPPTERR